MKNGHRHVATLPWQPIFFLKVPPLVYFQKICQFWRYALLIVSRRMSILEIRTFDCKPTNVTLQNKLIKVTIIVDISILGFKAHCMRPTR